MKIKIYFLLIIINFCALNAQEKISILKGTNSAYIETYAENRLIGLLRQQGNSSENQDKKYELVNAYRLGSTSCKTLNDGLKTAFKWINLNKSYGKNFEKEVCRFKVMEKEDYKFHGYVDQFTKEMVLSFKGLEDGNFAVKLKLYDAYENFIEINDLKSLTEFKDLLNGKSSSNEINELFKN